MVQQELEWVPQMSLPALRWLKIKMFGLISYFLTCNILLFNTITNNSFKYIVLLTMICLLATQVQAELGKPSLLQPHKGKVFIYIDCSSTTEPAFEEYSIVFLHSICLMKSSMYFGFLHVINFNSFKYNEH